MYSVKIDADARVIAYDAMSLTDHVIHRGSDATYKYLTEKDFRDAAAYRQFVIDPKRHYFDKQGRIRRLVV